MRLSWRLENMLEHRVVLGLAPELAGVIGSEIEDYSDDELARVCEWMSHRDCEFESIDRGNISAEIARRKIIH